MGSFVDTTSWYLESYPFEIENLSKYLLLGGKMNNKRLYIALLVFVIIVAVLTIIAPFKSPFTSDPTQSVEVVRAPKIWGNWVLNGLTLFASILIIFDAVYLVILGILILRAQNSDNRFAKRSIKYKVDANKKYSVALALFGLLILCLHIAHSLTT